MPEQQKRGAFIVFEGLDRSGKSTQAAMLVDRLKQERADVKLIKFPDRTTPVGKMIDSYLRSQSELDDRAIHLLFSANRWELASHSSCGHDHRCDRYAFSGIAFSFCKPSNLSYEWCRAPDIGLPAPDLTLFLDVGPDTVKSRGGFGEERYETEEVQQKVKDVFERIGEEMGMGLLTEGGWVVVEGDFEKEKVAEVIWDWVKPLSGGVSRPLRTLWDEKENKERNDQLYI
ncbi:thymidylate kinase [Fomitopsis serialis]|uniref:thymidylate kinase n=1 Tax=Fomitopsis serialis TaxID=139415 RepID=UPI0020086C23|nr:thymidylate kinase [Neoantrodia serialis]KAH9933432.1 thymidylate kinase [Neoantrodia serialis]